MPKILVTIPAYNEQATIVKVISEIQVALRKEDYEIVVVSDGSTDHTNLLAEQAGAKVVDKPHGGLADTFRAEMANAIKINPDVIVHIDADGQYSAFDIPKLLDKMKRTGADLVLGNRPSGHIEEMPWTKRMFNFLGSVFFSILIGQRIGDVTTGLRAFTPEVAALKLYSDHTYTVEQLIKAKRAGFNIVNVPVLFMKREGKSRLIPSSFNYLWRTVKNMRGMLRR